MSGWKLPTSVTVCGQEFAIRSDYRAVLDAISALRDPELSPQEQHLQKHYFDHYKNLASATPYTLSPSQRSGFYHY